MARGAVTPALREMLSVLEADPEVRILLLTGEGKTFCAGDDHTSQS